MARVTIFVDAMVLQELVRFYDEEIEDKVKMIDRA